MGMVVLERMTENTDIMELKELIKKHQKYTGSEIAKRVLDTWTSTLAKFVKVMPLDYKRVLEERKNNKQVEATVG